MMKTINVDNITIGGGGPLVLISGPCVIEDEALSFEICAELKRITGELEMPFIFKASYDKANRTSIDSFRGPGIAEGLRVLAGVKERFGLPVLTDVHSVEEARLAGEVVDVIQIPAFLCRQTDLVVAAAETGKAVNIKKGQFLDPAGMGQVVKKALSTGNDKIILTERGASFGYNNLVVDYRGIPEMRSLGYPVVFDGTHSVQRPGGLGTATGGDRGMVKYLSRAAVGVGVDGLFMECHPDPDKARSDGPNSVALGDMAEMLAELKGLDDYVKENLLKE